MRNSVRGRKLIIIPKSHKLLFGIYTLIFITVLGIIGPLIYPIDPEVSQYRPYMEPSIEHPLGTDALGRDVLAQVLHGIGSSIYVGVIAALVAMGIGIIVGSVSGIKGGLIDEILMMLTNGILLLPTILILMYIAAMFRARSLELVAVIIGVTSWPIIARVVRAQFMSLKEREFVYISQLNGNSWFKIAMIDLMPNMALWLALAFAETVNGAILAEAGLSFIGLGPTGGVTLGRIFYWIQLTGIFSMIFYGLWWWIIPPLLLLILVTSSIIFIALGIEEILNPRLRGE